MTRRATRRPISAARRCFVCDLPYVVCRRRHAEDHAFLSWAEHRRTRPTRPPAPPPDTLT